MKPRIRRNRLDRAAPALEPYDTVLIVCEGKKTEPYYLEGLKRDYRLSNMNVHVTPANGTDPVSIVNFAIERLDEFERAFCVFDILGNNNYQAALLKLASSAAGQSGKLKAITSSPCFELWLLLHFLYTTKAYTAVGKKSAGARILADLKTHYPNYQKNSVTTFTELAPLLSKAIKHARQLTKFNNEHRTIHPSTNVHSLIHYLKALKSK
jgi:hypothetical protein